MKEENAKISSDENNVYLEIEDISECNFEIWEDTEKKKSRVQIRIPVNSWKKIVKSWNNQKTK